MRQPDLFRLLQKPWNSGRLIGPKAPLKPKHVWAIRQQLTTNVRASCSLGMGSLRARFDIEALVDDALALSEQFSL